MATARATSPGTVVYDGDCGFCSVCADWLDRHGTAGVVSWQRSDLAALGLTEDDVRARAYWLDADGRVAEQGAGAVLASLATCGAPWSWLARIGSLRVLRPLADLVYALVARNRHRLPGSTAACRL
ncbi:MAG: thiol-disulfide oxidoreductase [Nocardioides sp.]|nr:thiol-disulfide oxidoreductase [Nocardioides sp.]